MKNNYIYVPGLSESVADEVKKEKDAEAPRFITGTGAVKKKMIKGTGVMSIAISEMTGKYWK